MVLDNLDHKLNDIYLYHRLYPLYHYQKLCAQNLLYNMLCQNYIELNPYLRALINQE
nr:MAG TPA: Splicing factor SF3a60 binding domain [Caudoviricetes sp.]DAR22298.1 MAG TPA: Splicing factor SF3a60 binding domain [Caudoviricetes sp.]